MTGADGKEAGFMRRLRRRMTAVLTALLLLTLLIPWGLAEPAPGPHQTTVLFTHDLHSHFLPLERADGGESGGYARLIPLSTLIF